MYSYSLLYIICFQRVILHSEFPEGIENVRFDRPQGQAQDRSDLLMRQAVKPESRIYRPWLLAR